MALLEKDPGMARRTVLQAAEDRIAKTLIEWDRLKTEGVHMRVVAAANPCLSLRSEHQLPTQALMTERLGDPEVADMEPVPEREPVKSSHDLRVASCEDRQFASGRRAGLNLVETIELPIE